MSRKGPLLCLRNWRETAQPSLPRLVHSSVFQGQVLSLFFSPFLRRTGNTGTLFVSPKCSTTELHLKLLTLLWNVIRRSPFYLEPSKSPRLGLSTPSDRAASRAADRETRASSLRLWDAAAPENQVLSAAVQRSWALLLVLGICCRCCPQFGPGFDPHSPFYSLVGLECALVGGSFSSQSLC